MTTSCPLATPIEIAHREFEAALPKIDETLRFEFRGLPAQRRREAIADARAAAWLAWRGLVRRGRDPLLVGVTGIAHNAARYVRAGRQFGCGKVGRGRDVFRDKACTCVASRLLDLDACDRNASTGLSHCLDGFAHDHRATPADTAAFRIDFAHWLERLPERKRSIAERLASGETTSELARELGVTPGAISQTRGWLAQDWQQFQGANEMAMTS